MDNDALEIKLECLIWNGYTLSFIAGMYELTSPMHGRSSRYPSLSECVNKAYIAGHRDCKRIQ